MSHLLRDVIVSMVSGSVFLIGLFIALSQVGISLAPMLAGLGVAGFIIGFALQDTLGNFAAGGMILIYRPFDMDDYIEVAGVDGTVKKMNLVSTTITTPDNQSLIIPNSKIWGDVIRNKTGQRVRRVDLEFGISYGDSIELAEEVFRKVLATMPAVLTEPEPNIQVIRHGESSVDFIVRPWVKTEDYWPTYWAMQRAVKLAFDEAGITIPFPQRDVHHYRSDDNPSSQGTG
jgi:small conductance mechanosensitive channel